MELTANLTLTAKTAKSPCVGQGPAVPASLCPSPALLLVGGWGAGWTTLMV